MKIDIIKKYLFIMLFFLLPLLIAPQMYDSFFLPKFIFIKILCLLLLSLTIISVIWEKEFKIILHPLNLGIFLFFLFNLISGFNAQSISLWYEKISFLVIIVVFVLLFQDYFYNNRKELVIISYILVFTAAITSLWVLYQDFLAHFASQKIYITAKLPDWRGYLTAGFGNTNHIADFIAFNFVIALFSLLFSRSKIVRRAMLVSLCIMYAALIVCFSVSSNGGLIVALFVMFICIGFDYAKTKRFELRIIRRLVVLAIIFVFITLFYVTNNPLNPHKPSIFVQAFFSERWKAGGSTRLAIWANTLEIIRNHPWLGIGAGNFTYQFVMQKSPFLLRSDLMQYAGSYTNAAHNEILQIWSETGVFGLASICFSIVLFFVYALRIYFSKSKLNSLLSFITMVCMIEFIIHSQMNFTLEVPTYIIIFYALLCIPIVLGYRISQETIDLQFSSEYSEVSVRTRSLRIPESISIHLLLPKIIRYLLSFIIVAVAVFLISRQFNPILSDYHYKLARQYQEQKMDKNAMQEYITALKLNPEHSDCRSAYASKLLRDGKYEESIQQFQIVEKRLRSSEIFFQLAEAYLKLGNRAEAYKNLKIFFDMRPLAKLEYPQIYQNLNSLESK